MMFNTHDIQRDSCMLKGLLRKQGYDWWWHSFTGYEENTHEERSFFVEYFLCNPDLAEEKPVLGQLEENREKGKKPSYLMVKAGSWGKDHAQLHRFYSWKEIEVSESFPYVILGQDCYASETELRGNISISEVEARNHPEWMCDAGEMSWRLSLDKQIAFNVGYGASKPLQDAEAFAMYWHAEGMKTAYLGDVIYNGKRYLVTPEKCYGYADKNWGRDFTSPWLWLSSNDLVSRKTGERLSNSVFDIGGGRPKIYMVPLDRRLLGAFYYEGKEYDFNFSKLHLGVKTMFSFTEDEETCYWKVVQTNHHARMETDITCKKKDMLLVNYESPDGKKRHNRLWNGGNGTGVIRLYDKGKNGYELVDEIEANHIGCEYGEYDE